MLFIDNKYTTWYNSIITKAKSRSLTKKTYTERHHIIPKSLSGSNSKENLVRLTAREHFVCHWLLTKMVTGSGRPKMICAFHKMYSKSELHHRYSTKITSRVFEHLKIKHAQVISDMNTGRKMSAETKEKIRQAMQGKNKGKVRTEELKQHLSSIATGRKMGPMTEEQREKIRIANTGKSKSTSHCKNMSIARKGKPWSSARRLAQNNRLS